MEGESVGGQYVENAPGRLPRMAVLALAAPIAWLADRAGSEVAAFAFSIVGIVGGAFLLGEAAEEVASRLGEGLGSLVTATFSNLVTLTILLAALFKGLYAIVEAAIVGAILGNILFALGGAMVLGGRLREKQVFSQEAAASNATLLIMAGFAILLPSLVVNIEGAGVDPFLAGDLATAIAVILFLTYIVGLVFSFRTHRHLFNPTYEPVENRAHPLIERMPVVVLALSVLMVAVLAEILAGGIEPVGRALGLGELFLAVVVVGVVTNSVEIAAAWKFAVKDRMNLTIQIATGSGIQVILFVVPVLVLVSLFLPTGVLSLSFTMPMVLMVGMSTLLVNLVASDGESTWYEGVLLLALYAIVAVVFFFAPGS